MLPRNRKWAVIWFAVTYVFVNIPATGLYFLVAAIMASPVSSAHEIMGDPAYIFAHKLYPILNLLLWTIAAWLYFRKAPNEETTTRSTVQLGLFWLAIALPLDLVFYVLIPSPMAMNFADFYAGQFPWIYLTYLAVAISPLCYRGIRRKG